MNYIKVNKSLRSICTQFKKDNNKYLELRNDVLTEILPLSTEPIFVDLINTIVSSTKETFISSIETAIDTIYEKYINNKIIDLDMINEEIQKNTPPSKIYKDVNYSYEIRKESFFNYIKTYLKKHHLERKDVVDYLCKIPLYFLLPIHRKRFKLRKKFIKIDFDCNHAGHSRGNTKSENCGYQLTIRFYYDGQITYNEKPHDPIKLVDHSHLMSLNFVLSKNTMLTKEHRKDIKEAIKKEKSLEDYIVKNEDIGIQTRFIKTMAKELKIDTDEEVSYLSKNTFKENGFIRITNRFGDDKSIHSLLYIFEKVAQDPSCSDIFFVDDTTNTNIYGKRLFTFFSKNTYGYSQLLAFAFIQDGSLDSFRLITEQLRTIINYEPRIILTDRNYTQISALSVFTSSKIIYCSIHVERSIRKYYSEKSVIMRAYHLMMSRKITEEQLETIWREAFQTEDVKEKKEDNRMDEEEYLSEDSSDDEEYEYKDIQNKSIKKKDDLFYNSRDYEFDEPLQEKVEEMIEEAKKLKSKEGGNCLKKLLKEKEHWMISYIIESGLYRDCTTNIPEGFYGNLKERIGHKKLKLEKLITIIKSIAIERYRRTYEISLSNGIINKKDPMFQNMTEISKLILQEQWKLFKNKNYNQDGKRCLSCIISKKNPEICFPCVHFIEKNYKKKAPHIQIKMLPKRCFKSTKQISIKYTNCSKTNLVKEMNVSVLNGVGYITSLHNTNFKSRNNVDKRRRILRENIETYSYIQLSEEIKRNPRNKENVKRGFLTSIPFIIKFGSKEELEEISEENCIETNENIPEENEKYEKKVIEGEHDFELFEDNIEEQVNEKENINDDTNEEYIQTTNNENNHKMVIDNENRKEHGLKENNENIGTIDNDSESEENSESSESEDNNEFVFNIDIDNYSHGYYFNNFNIYDSLKLHSWVEFNEYTSNENLFEKIIFPLFDGFNYSIYVLCKQFIINGNYKSNTLIYICHIDLKINSNIQMKMREYTKRKYGKKYDKHYISKLNVDEKYFIERESFEKLCCLLSSNSFTTRTDIIEIIKNYEEQQMEEC